MTDITELAQSLKAEDISSERMEWLKKLADMEYCASNPGHWLMNLKETNYLASLALQCLESNSALAEALEKAQTINAAAEKLVRCKGRYHSEQNYRALAALFGVKTPDLPPLEHENVHYADAAEMEIEALRQRIAELESRTVKLPDLRQILSGDRYVWSDGVYNYSQDVKVTLAAAGIKVEAE